MTHFIIMPFTPTISIVTPSFNQAEYLKECIESVLGQGYPNLEYVIMDGGSTDGSVEIIKKYEKYLSYWQSCPDGGQYKAISEGFRHTSGEIMAWLNSDDKYHPLAFAKVMSVFEWHPHVKWLTGRKSFWDASGNLSKIEDTLPVFSRRKFLEGNFDKPYIQQESTFWRRSLWDEAGRYIDDTASLAGDLELWLRFFRHAPLHTVDALLGGYRFNPGQRGVSHADEYLKESCAFTLKEQQLCQTPRAELPAPPSHITVPRDRLSNFILRHRIKPSNPNHVTCWCEYTEDLIANIHALIKERQVGVTEFWENEISLFALVKPRVAWLLGEPLEALRALNSQVSTLLDEGCGYETVGAYSEALRCYSGAFAMAPSCPVAGTRLTLCLWAMSAHVEALGLLPDLLSRHAHDSGVVSAAVKILVKYGAAEQARGVCREFIMTDPHNAEIQALRGSLEC